MRFIGLSWTIKQVLDGAMGDLLKLYGHYMLAYAERPGTTLVLRSRVRVIKHWKSRQSHLLIGKYGSVVDNIKINYFFKSEWPVLQHFDDECLFEQVGSL